MSSVIAPDAPISSGSAAGHGRWIASAWLLWIGAAALIVPTIIQLAQQYWSQEEGGHGPIVLATGVWLLVRSRGAVRAVAQPGNSALSFAVLAASLLG
ncbi:MAG: hypothetical protein EOO77_23545, partial [Oxalobacteraceae bacterium]